MWFRSLLNTLSKMTTCISVTSVVQRRRRDLGIAGRQGWPPRPTPPRASAARPIPSWLSSPRPDRRPRPRDRRPAGRRAAGRAQAAPSLAATWPPRRPAVTAGEPPLPRGAGQPRHDAAGAPGAHAGRATAPLYIVSPLARRRCFRGGKNDVSVVCVQLLEQLPPKMHNE